MGKQEAIKMLSMQPNRKRNPVARNLLTNPLYKPKQTKDKDRYNRKVKHKTLNV